MDNEKNTFTNKKNSFVGYTIDLFISCVGSQFHRISKEMSMIFKLSSLVDLKKKKIRVGLMLLITHSHLSE